MNLYPCEECGFQGGDVNEIEEHQQNHKDLGTKISNITNKSYDNILITDGDLEVDDDSDEDEDWTRSKEDENLLREDSEDEFMFNCNQCEFDTIWEDQLKNHIEWQHKRQKRPLKRKSDCSILSIQAKKTKPLSQESPAETTGLQCKVCNHKVRDNFNLKRHMRKHN